MGDRRAVADARGELSFGEERFWVLDAIAPGSHAYALISAYRLAGALDVDRLRRAVSGVIARHDILRARYTEVDGRPVRRIAPVDPSGFPIELEDLEITSGDDADALIRRRSSEIGSLGVDLDEGPLIRAVLLRFGEDDHAFVLAVHHILIDEWSLRLMLDEVSELYVAGAEGRAPELPALPIQYAEFAARQREAQSQPAAAVSLQWWKDELEGSRTTLGIPTDRIGRSQVRRAGRAKFAVPAGDLEALQALCAAEGASLFMGGLAAFALLLSRYARRREVVIGTPFAERGRSDVDALVGYFLNTLPIRLQLPEGSTFREWIRFVRGRSLDAFGHCDVPYERIVREANPERKIGSDPLIQAVFVLVGRTAPPRLLGLETREVPRESDHAKFDLTLFLDPSADGVGSTLEFAHDLFDQGTAEAMAGAFVTLVTGLVDSPDVPVDSIPLLDVATQGRVVELARGGGSPAPTGNDVSSLFREVACAHEAKPALIVGGKSVTYGDLAGRVEWMARHLASAGVERGDRVGVLAERSMAFVVTVIAILRAGCAYVPLDSESPPERLSAIIEGAGVRMIVAAADVPREVLGGRALIPISIAGREPPETLPLGEAFVDEGATAYVMYTSGTTGVPKGVVVPHRAVVNLVHGQRYAPVGPRERFLLLAPPSFDASTFELWTPLLSGATLVIGPPDVPSPADLEGLLRESRVSVLWLGAAFFNQILDDRPHALDGVATILVGGEALSVDHMRRAREAMPDTLFVNGYGPTENTTFSCTYDLPHTSELDRPSIPIGRSLANALAVVLDENLVPLPIGAPGELHVGGDGLADGYLGDAGLTAERFRVPDVGPLAGVRLYATGDLCRVRADRNVEFLGRIDRQLKVLGHRVEPGEVEAALCRHAAVRRAVVSLKATPVGPRLVGHYEVKPGLAVEPSAVRAHVASLLPRYMVPALLVGLERMPVTPSGKIDFGALPAVDWRTAPTDVEPPRSRAEDWLASIWAEVLGRASIPRDASFFDLGGDSLSMMRVVARVEQETGERVPLPLLMTSPTVEAGARLIGESERSQSGFHHLNECKGANPWFGVPGTPRHGMVFGHLAGHLSAPFIGLELPRADADGREPLESIEAMAACCLETIVAQAPTGPYRLCGYSFGGPLAWEIAAQLEARGETVDALVIFDAVSPTCKTRGPWRRRLARLHMLLRGPGADRAIYLRERWGSLTGRDVRGRAESARPREDRAYWLSGDFARLLLGAYRPPVLQADVVLFRPRQRPGRFEIEGVPYDAGWGELTKGALRVELLESAHVDLLRSSEIQRVAELMSSLVDTASST